MINSFEKYIPRLYYHKVSWKVPNVGWMVCNTDGGSRGNPEHSAYAFYIKD